MQSDDVLVSPPIFTMSPGGCQVVRLLLRRPPLEQESTYRIQVDQIPPSASSSAMRVALRMSLPLFAESTTAAAPRLQGVTSVPQFRIERANNQYDLVAVNNGVRHVALSDLTLTTSDGRMLEIEMPTPPYVLARATRRWRLATPAVPLASDSTAHLSAKAETGAIDQVIPIISMR
jgi:fimbrial chaperone protein